MRQVLRRAAARDPRGPAARRLFRRGRRRSGLPRARRAGGRRRRGLPDHRRQRQPGSTSSPATRSPTSRPSGRPPIRSSSARSTRRWRTATSPSTPRPSTRRLSRDRHRLRGLAHHAGLGRRQRVLRPVVRPDRLRPRPARRAVHRVRPLPGAGGHGARVRARDAGPVRLLRARHPGRDAGRLPGRRLDRLGRGRRVRARVAPDSRTWTTSSAATCCWATTSAAIRTTPRPTAPTSTGCRRSTRASTAAWPRAVTTSARTGCSPLPPSPATRSTPAEATRRST